MLFRSLERKASRLSFSRNQTNSVLIGDFVSNLRLESNDLLGCLEVNAPTFADLITVVGNTIATSAPTAIALRGKLGTVRVMDNDVLASGGSGIVVNGATSGLVSGNNTLACPSRDLVIEDSIGVQVLDNVAALP